MILVSYTNLPTGLWTINRNYNQVVSHRERQLLGWCLCFVGQFILTCPQDCEQSIEVITKLWAIGKGSWLADAYVLLDSLAWEWSLMMTTHVYLWWPGTPVPSLSCLLVRTPSSFLHLSVSVCLCVCVCACVCVCVCLYVSVCVCLCVRTCVFVEHSHLFGVLIEKLTVELCVELCVARVYSGRALHTQLHAAVCVALGFYLLKLSISLSFCSQCYTTY